MEQFNPTELVNAIFKLPQTQKDINQLAQVSQQAQSPEVQKSVQDLVSRAESLAMVYLLLQVIGTSVAVGSFILQITDKGKK